MFKNKIIKILTILIILVVCIYILIRIISKAQVIKEYELANQFLHQGDFTRAIFGYKKALKRSPDAEWAKEAQAKINYCYFITSGETEFELSSGHKPPKIIRHFSSLGFISFIVFIVLIALGVFLWWRFWVHKRAQKLSLYFYTVEKRIRSNLKPTGEKKIKGEVSSITDYQKYITHRQKGEYVSLARCLLGEYYLELSPDDEGRINSLKEDYIKFLNDYAVSLYTEEIIYKLANLYFFQLGDYVKAVELYQRLVKNYPQSKWLKIAQSRINLVKDNPDLEYKPLSLYIKGEKNYESKKYLESIEWFTRLLNTFPLSNLADDSQYAMADIYLYKMNESERAINEYEKLIKNYPQSIHADNAQYKIGESYKKLSRWEDAVRTYQKYIDNYPNSEFLDYGYYYLAQCLEKIRNFSQSKEIYQIIVEKYPASIWVVVATSRLAALKIIK